MPRDAQALLIRAGVLAWVAAQYAFVHDLPLLADDHVHLEAARSWSGVDDLLAAEPRRPLQHAVFWLGAPWGDAGAAAMRAVGGASYLASLALVGALARQLGMSARGAALAIVLFAVFPAGATVWWPSAVNAPGRLAATLLACWAFGKGPHAVWALVACAAAAVAVAFHPSAVLLPLFLLLLQWARGTTDATNATNATNGSRWFAGFGAAVAAVARRPAYWIVAAIVVGAAWWASATPHPHHGGRAPMAIVANLTWASAGLWPEMLRVLAVDGVRGEHGFAARLLGAAAIAAFATAAFAAVWRDRGWLRCVVLIAAAELAFAAVVAGWTARYAFVAAAFVVVGACAAAGKRWHVAVLAAVGVTWFADSVRALVEFRGAAVLSQQLVARAVAVRQELPPAAPLFVLDLPDTTGFAGDIPLANWGFVQAMRAAGADGEVRLVRTTRPVASSAGAVVPEAMAEQLRRTADVLEFDPATCAFVQWRGGQRLEPR